MDLAQNTQDRGSSIYGGYLKKQCPGLITPAKHPKESNAWYSQVADSDLCDYHLWTIVRNPYDRFLSIAGHLKTEPEYLARKFKKIRRPRGMAFHHSHEQWKFTHHKNGYAFVQKFDNLDDSFAQVCRKIGLPNTIFPHKNKSLLRNSAISHRVRDFVEQQNERDFALLRNAMNGKF